MMHPLEILLTDLTFMFMRYIEYVCTMVLYKNTCSGPWNVVAEGDAPSFTNFLYVQALTDNEDEISFRYESYKGPSIMMLKLNPSGKIQRLIWNERSTA